MAKKPKKPWEPREPREPRVGFTMWDFKGAPDVDDLNYIMTQFKSPIRFYYMETGGNDYCLAIADRPLSLVEIEQAFEEFWEGAGEEDSDSDSDSDHDPTDEEATPKLGKVIPFERRSRHTNEE